MAAVESAAAAAAPPTATTATADTAYNNTLTSTSTSTHNTMPSSSRRGSINLFTRLKKQQHHSAQEGSDDSNLTSNSYSLSHDNGKAGLQYHHRGSTDNNPPLPKKKSRRTIWSRRSEPPPPVPELPPSLNIRLPFEPSSSTITTSASLSSTTDTKSDYVIVPTPGRNARSATLDSLPSQQVSPSPAAAMVHQYAAKEQRLQDSGVNRAQALADARLNVKQVTQIIQLAGSEIKQRGLANVGILRPFRVGTETRTVDRLAELYLLTIDPEKYANVLSIHPPDDPLAVGTSDIAIATFGKPSPRKELTKQLAYANVHSVADLLKWAVRRLKVTPANDFNATAESPLSWYDSFLQAEKSSGYDPKAFSTILLPSLPPATRTLLTELFDLLTTISAHYIANAMPASRATKSFGYWLFGRIGTDKPAQQDLDTFLQEWKRTSAIMEHLLLAYLRDQSTKLHHMPTRLNELIREYPFIPTGSPCPAIPTNNSTSATSTNNSGWALRVQLRGDNIITSPNRPRGPHDILSSALDARLLDSESSAEADDWTCLVTLAKAAVKRVHLANESGREEEEEKEISLDEGAVTSAKHSALLKEEDVRLFEILTQEFNARKKLLGVRDAEHNVTDTDAWKKAWNGSSASLARQSSIYKDFMARPAGAATSTTTDVPLRSRKRLSTLAEDASPSMGTPKVTSALDMNGGLGSLDTKDLDLSLDVLDIPSYRKTTPRASLDTRDSTAGTGQANGVSSSSAAAPTPSMASKIRRQSSLGALRHRVRGSKRWDNDTSVPPLPSVPAVTGPSFSVTKVTNLSPFEENVISLWQDSILDSQASMNLPRMVIVELNSASSSQLMSSSTGRTWLVIEESLHSPKPATQSSSEGVTRLKGSSGTRSSDDDFSLKSKRSLFSPSLRSFGASIKKRASLRRMSSFTTINRKKKDSSQDEQIGAVNGRASNATATAIAGEGAQPRMSSAASSRYADAEAGDE
ncbi:unnamed protein product [Sympodiomycopsis kandeliae]